jgi:hypothetical protein
MLWDFMAAAEAGAEEANTEAEADHEAGGGEVDDEVDDRDEAVDEEEEEEEEEVTEREGSLRDSMWMRLGDGGGTTHSSPGAPFSVRSAHLRVSSSR